MKRRRFLQTTVAAAAPVLGDAFAQSTVPKVRLGMDHFSVRATGWKAPQFIEHAASLKLDTVFLSELIVFESFEDAYLQALKTQADQADIALYIGTSSVCPTSGSFKPTFGTAEEHLALNIRVAKTLGSPVARCYLGNNNDRKGDGGIQRHIEALLKVFKACKNQAVDAGLKLSIENHAGDMQSHELVALIEAAGKDWVGANIDPGNAAWVMEDPLRHLEILGPYVNCSSVRDSMIWESENGATVQWTAISEGLVDFKAYAKRFAELCPGVPLNIETISGFAKSLPFKKPEFIKELGYEKMPADDLAAFEALAKKGQAIPPFKAADKAADIAYQKGELERSVAALRSYGVGVKA
ncbi:MAG: sugar phosphate isomerase/epimerase family protein [Roseimicrobium sp.]